MPPEITDALIAGAIQNARMVDAGRDYWTRGRVHQLTSTDDQVSALVSGSGKAPYEVNLHFSASARLSTECTCPVGSGCKHAAATLFALRAELGKAQVKGSQAPSPVPSPSPAPLPPALSQWLGAMRPLMHEVTKTSARATRAVFYVVRAQALTGSMRMSNKRSAASLASPGRPVRLFAEALDVLLDEEGRPLGGGAKLQSYLLPYAAAVSASPFAAEDQLIVRRLQARIGDTDYEGCLTGVGGFDLLTRMIATGRARWGGVRGPALWLDHPAGVTLCWSHDQLGHASLTVASAAPEAVVALVAPPVMIDAVSGRVAPVDAGVTAAVAEQLLRLPPVAAEAIEALAARWGEAAPAHIPPPAPLDIRDLGRLRPQPVLSLFVDRVQVDEWPTSRWGRSRKVRTDCAVARLTFDYGLTVIDAAADMGTMLVRDGETLVRFSRDLTAESTAIDRLAATDLMPIPDFDGVHSTPLQDWDYAPGLPAAPEDFTSFLLRDAEALRRDGWRVEMAADFPLKLVRAEKDSLGVALTPSGIDWFEMELGATIEGERIDLVPALRRLLSSLGQGEIDELLDQIPKPGDVLPVALGDGRVATIEADRVLPMLRALLLLASHEPVDGLSARARLSRRDLGLLAELETTTRGLPWSGAEPLRRLARALSEVKFEPTPLPASFKAALRPYQQTGLDWLDALARAGFGGLLADDMGLGKTVQTLAHIAVMKVRGDLSQPVLILAPTSVLPNWQAEAERFTPDLSVLLLHGPDRRDRHGDIAAHDIVLTSYPLLVRDQPQLLKAAFSLIVFDEAHNLKNPRTASHAAARELVADRKIALTGTPVENRLNDAWALFDLVTPGLLGSQRDFARDYRGLSDATATPDVRARLARKLRPFLLRRTKEAVAADLPPKSVVPLSISLGPAQMALHESQRLLMHDRVRDEIARVGLMRAQIIVLTALTRLRQICCDPRLIGGDAAKTAPSAKLERLIELLEEMIPEGRRIILFSQFTSMLDLIKPELDRLGVAWTELTGRTKDRKSPVADFQSGKASMILVSLKAGGTGLNLTAADTVLLYDPWWNPAIEAQAIDRAHRIGQTKPVFVYRMVAAGTIEDKILQLQQRKAALAAALWSEDAATSAQLSEDDIAFLLG